MPLQPTKPPPSSADEHMKLRLEKQQPLEEPGGKGKQPQQQQQQAAAAAAAAAAAGGFKTLAHCSKFKTLKRKPLRTNLFKQNNFYF